MNSQQTVMRPRGSARQWFYRGCMITFVFVAAGVCLMSSFGVFALVRGL